MSLFSDGTKIRATEAEEFKPEFPESLDVKITNKCDLNCAYCHERSVATGKHCDPDNLLEVLSGLPAGVELALGGGNPLEHPDLVPLLKKLKALGFVCNITANGRHLGGVSEYNSVLNVLVEEGLVHGIGVTWVKGGPNDYKINSKNVVAHLVMGVLNVEDIVQAQERFGKVLLLGYKQYGRGTRYYSERVEQRIDALRRALGDLMPRSLMSFDNLAIKQLDLQTLLPSSVWDEFYMGDDGTFTMYYDAVNDEYAPSSTCPRVNANHVSVYEYFQSNLVRA